MKSELPENWVSVSFETIYENISISKLKIKEDEYLADGLYPVIDQSSSKLVSGFSNDPSKLVNHDGTKIIFGDHTKVIKLFNDPFVPGADGIKVLNVNSTVSIKYAFYLLKSLKIPNKGYARHFSLLKNFSYPIAPYAEQIRIVQKIEELFSEVDDGIQSLETAKKQLDIYREALLIQAFEGTLTEEWRKNHQNLVSTTEILKSKFSNERKLRYENEIEKWKASVKEWELKQLEGRKPTKPRAPKDVQKLTKDTLSTLPAIPSEWYWDTLGNITSSVEYGTSAKSQESGSVPVIRMGNIQQGVIDWDDLVYTSDEQEIKQYDLKAGDVLFNRTNSPELVGKTAIYKGEQPAIFAGYLIRVNHYSNLIDSNFLNYYLNSHIAKTYGNSVNTDGVNQSNINGEKLQNYPFPFCSLEEQLEIVKIISNFLDKEKVTRQYLDSELKRAHLLKQSILQKAFSGELVPQDPNDEPASVLLERIKAEKEEELTKAKANKIPKKSTKRKTKTIKEDEPAQQELI